MTTTAKAKTHTVSAPLIQVGGPAPFTDQRTAPERTLRHGAVLPWWVADEEIQRLLELGMIAEVA